MTALFKAERQVKVRECSQPFPELSRLQAAHYLNDVLRPLLTIKLLAGNAGWRELLGQGVHHSFRGSHHKASRVMVLQQY